MTILSYGF